MRRGQHPVSFVFGMVLMVLVILVAVIITLRWRDISGNVEDDAPCATAIRAHAIVMQGSKESINLPIVCPTQRVTVDSKDQEQVKRAIADEMKSCWSMWGAGKLQLFGDNDGNYCHVCSVITMTNVERVDGLPEYLRTHTTTGGQSYAEYFAGERAGTIYEDKKFQEAAQASFPTKEPVGVIFYYAKGHTTMENLVKNIVGDPKIGLTAGTVAGVGAGYVVGTTLVAIGLVSNPVGWAIGGCIVAGGAISGALFSISARPDTSYMAFVAARPLTAESLKTLGCQYAPVRNE